MRIGFFAAALYAATCCACAVVFTQPIGGQACHFSPMKRSVLAWPAAGWEHSVLVFFSKRFMNPVRELQQEQLVVFIIMWLNYWVSFSERKP